VPDVLAWLTAAGASTERIELGTAILQVPLRHPVELAQRLMSVHASARFYFGGLGLAVTIRRTENSRRTRSEITALPWAPISDVRSP
jgi:hypothetical protein